VKYHTISEVEENLRIVRNDVTEYYHIHSWIGEETRTISNLLEKFAKLGFTGYEILKRNSEYVIHFSDSATEAQFLLYFNDYIATGVKSLADMKKFTIIEHY